MRLRAKPILPAILIVLSTFATSAVRQEAPEYGPPKGTLVIVGGNMARTSPLYDKFIQLAGGADAKFVIVPTAGGNRTANGSLRIYKEEDSIRPWLARGLKNVKMLHTADPKEANTEAFVQPLREANVVWFDGGRQWNCVDSYAGTLTEKEFHNVLARATSTT